MTDLAALRTCVNTVDTAAICDADKMARVMSSAIRCRSRNPRMCGLAYTVRCRGDFFAVLRGMVAAKAGDVLVVDGGSAELALAGELVTRTAAIKGLAGIIVDGGYRDMAYVTSADLPVFSRHVTPMAGDTKHLGELQVPISCGGVTVRPGDLVVSDAEGIVVLDARGAMETLERAIVVKETEGSAIAHFDQQRQMADLLNFAEHDKRLQEGRPSTLHFVDESNNTSLPLAGN